MKTAVAFNWKSTLDNPHFCVTVLEKGDSLGDLSDLRDLCALCEWFCE
jgi:hypothetical protein